MDNQSPEPNGSVQTLGSLVEFRISQEIEDMIKKGKKDALIRCNLYGHDYQDVDGISGGKICICCGSRPNQSLELTKEGSDDFGKNVLIYRKGE